MKRRAIILLAVFFFLSISGLILVQVSWIEKAVAVTDQQFRYMANKALESVVLDLEKNEIIENIVEEIKPAETDSITVFVPADSPFARTLHENRNEAPAEKEAPADEMVAITSSGHKIFITAENIPPYSLGETGDPSPQVTRSEIQGRVTNKIIVLEDLMRKTLNNPPDIRDRIDFDSLQARLRAALNDVEIYLDFEFSVRSGRQGIIWQTPGFADKPETNRFIIQLFPNDPVPGHDQIVLYCLQENQYIFEKTGNLGAFSILFLFILIVLSTGTFIIIFRQKKISEIRNDFINNMTHELKTPISTISLASQMLLDKTIPEDDKNTEALSEIISDESQKLKQLAEKVLQIAILERTSMNFNMNYCNIHEIIDKAVNNFGLQIKSRQGKISKDFKAVNAVIKADETHMVNAISNLIDNAIKYSREKTDILISTINANEEFEITVADNGIGIHKNDINRIFEKFYRAPSGNIHNVRGVGLGLSYVRKVIEKHRGIIKVKSVPDKGTTFKIIIPQAEIK
ncbi:MAG: HAMP domain-containing histidine kinase [Bacteroidales bacterium]|jgi:signal transduction histidine kinase|nr:HAMP domain-containing histidine kinase [Bacteroidales bacterium]